MDNHGLDIIPDFSLDSISVPCLHVSVPQPSSHPSDPRYRDPVACTTNSASACTQTHAPLFVRAPPPPPPLCGRRGQIFTCGVCAPTMRAAVRNAAASDRWIWEVDRAGGAVPVTQSRPRSCPGLLPGPGPGGSHSWPGQWAVLSLLRAGQRRVEGGPGTAAGQFRANRS